MRSTGFHSTLSGKVWFFGLRVMVTSAHLEGGEVAEGAQAQSPRDKHHVVKGKRFAGVFL